MAGAPTRAVSAARSALDRRLGGRDRRDRDGRAAGHLLEEAGALGQRRVVERVQVVRERVPRARGGVRAGGDRDALARRAALVGLAPLAHLAAVVGTRQQRVRARWE